MLFYQSWTWYHVFNDRWRILHKWLTGWKPDEKSQKNSDDVKFTWVIFSRGALRSLCPCHRLNSRWCCLLYQTPKVPLFHCCTSITHGNASALFQLLPCQSTRLRQVKWNSEKALANRCVSDYFQVMVWRFSDLNHLSIFLDGIHSV